MLGLESRWRGASTSRGRLYWAATALAILLLNLVQEVASTVISVSVSYGSSTASDSTTYTFLITDNQAVGNNNQYTFTLQQGVRRADSPPSAVLTYSQGSNDFEYPASCSISSGSNKLRCTVFPTELIPTNTQFTLVVPGIINPPSARDASAGEAVVVGENDFGVSLALPAIQPGSLVAASVAAQIRMLGATSSYDFSVTLRVSANSGDDLTIDLPAGTAVSVMDLRAEIAGVGADSSLYLGELDYDIQPTYTRLKLPIFFVGSVFLQGQPIAITIFGITNPATQPASFAVDVALRDGERLRDQITIEMLAFTIRCPKGTYSPNLDATAENQCIDCAPGKFADTDGNSECTECDYGYYSAAPKATACLPCGFGTHASAKGQDHCDDCDPGRYANELGTKDCLECDPGRFAIAPKTVNCEECAVDYHAPEPGASQCLPCLDGKKTIQGGRSVCDYCEAGRYKTVADGNCALCVGGKYTTAKNQATACSICIQGKFSETGASTCENCLAGQYAPASGSSICLNCPAGRFTSQPSQSACLPCSSGKAAAPGSSVCGDCVGGTYAPALSGTCQQCPPGYFSGAQASQCSPCIEGDFAKDPGTSSCGRCQAGTYTDAPASTVCKSCDPGTFQGQTRQSTCNQCEVDTHAPDPEATTCIPCSTLGEGFKAPIKGSSECVYVPPGCAPGSRVITNPATGLTECMLCEAGTITTDYSIDEGTCEACPPGKYAPQPGLSVCTDCEYGKFAANPGSSACSECALGYEAPEEAATECVPCQPGYSTIAPGSKNCLVCAPGKIAPAVATPMCETCAVGKFASSIGATACMDCPTGTVTSTVGASRASQCVVPLCEDLSAQVAARAPLIMSVAPGRYGVNKFGSVVTFRCPEVGENGNNREYVLIGESTAVCVPPSVTDAERVPTWGDDANQVKGVWMPASLPNCVEPTPQSELDYRHIHRLVFATQPPAVVQQGEKFSVTVDAVSSTGVVVRNPNIIVELVLNTTSAEISTTQNPASMLSNPSTIRVHGSNYLKPIQGRTAFTMLELHTVGTKFVLQANVYSLADGSPSTRLIGSAYSQFITVVPTPAVRLVLTTPLRVTADTAFPQIVKVSFANALGNPVTSGTPNSVITLGIVESDFWFTGQNPGTTKQMIPTAGEASFQDLMVSTSRTLTNDYATFHFYAETPEFKRVVSTPIRLYRDTANNEISRFREYLRPVSFSVVVYSFGLDLTSTANAAETTVYRRLFRDDICYALSLSSSGCSRVQVLEAVSVEGEATASNPTTTYGPGYYRIRIQINPPLSISQTDSSGIAVAGHTPAPPTSSDNDQGMAVMDSGASRARAFLRSLLNRPENVAPHRRGLNHSHASHVAQTVSFAELKALTLEATAPNKQNSAYGAYFDPLANPILPVVPADSATSMELLQSLESQFASEPDWSSPTETTIPLIYKTTYAAQSDGASFQPLFSSAAQTSTPDTLNPIDDSTGTPVEKSTGFIAGLSGGLGGVALILVGIFVLYKLRQYYLNRKPPVVRPRPVEQPVVKAAAPTARTTQLFYAQPPSKQRTGRSRTQYVASDGTVSRQVVFHI